MSEYGVTPTGFVKKRLDVVLKEVQDDLTEKFGFDVALNPQSFLNVLITNFGDRIAQLWEVAEQVYYSQYPSSAEGVNLDYAGQLGGITREGDKRTKYLVLCTGADGSAIPSGAVIASTTTPQIRFTVLDDYEITRTAFNKAEVKVVSVESEAYYTVSINGNSFSYLSNVEDNAESIISALAESITLEDFTVTENGDVLEISCNSDTISNDLTLSENLTTERVSTLIIWESEEFGKFVLPKGSISQIITTLTGFESCKSVSVPFYGRLRETDVEFRQSYLKKIASRSSCMLESITSAIMESVESVSSARGYENYSDEVDSEGRPPHSIEIVVDGGDEAEIASVILKTKSAGIGTHGGVSVDVPTVYGDTININFSRPESIYVWYKVAVTRNPLQPFPPNYEELIKTAILKCMSDLRAGDAVITQDYISKIKEECTGLAYVDITVYGTNDAAYTPTGAQYTERNLFITSRQKTFSTEERIEVVLSGS